MPGSKARALYRNLSPANKRETPQIDEICEDIWRPRLIKAAPGARKHPRTGHARPVLCLKQALNKSELPRSEKSRRTYQTLLKLVQLDLHINAGREIQLHQRIDCLVGRIYDIKQALMGADFVLIARIFVYMRRN